MGDATAVENAICDWFFYNCGYCVNIYTGGIPLQPPLVVGRKKYYQLRPNPKRVGTADLMACLKGRSYRIEVKVRKDRESIEQEVDRLNYEDSGGISMIVKTFDHFLEKMDDLKMK